MTTNLLLKDMRHPGDISYQRIYDRIIGRCVPMRVVGEDLRIKAARERREREENERKTEKENDPTDQ